MPKCCSWAVFHHNASDGASISTIPTSSTIIGASRDKCSLGIEGQVFFGDRNHFVDLAEKRFKIDDIVAFCEEKGIAFFDTSSAVRRLKDNASDKFLEVVEPTDIPALIAQLPHLRAIVTTGEKATDTICASLNIPTPPKVNTYVPIPNTRQLVLYRLPSSSRAYPLAFDKKAQAYQQMFSFVGYTIFK